MIEVIKLAAVPDFSSECASWLHAEWGYRKPSSTFADVKKRFADRANQDELPIAFVALLDRCLAGTASLVAKEDSWDTNGPWVASVFVPAPYRGKGIARRLVHETEAEAKRHGFREIWLSASVPEMYSKLGYRFTSFRKHGEPVMVKTLA